MRSFVISLVLLASIGCKQQPTLDPFSAYGPATIAPPSTGTAGRADPYYRKTLSSTNRYGPSAQTVFTSDQNAGRTEVADQRGNVQAGINDNTSKMQWRSPVNDGYSNDPLEAEVVGSGRARPRLPASRRLGRASTPSATDEPVIIDQNAIGGSGALSGSYQGLPPTPRVDQQVAPASFQQPASTGSGWQSRY